MKILTFNTNNICDSVEQTVFQLRQSLLLNNSGKIKIIDIFAVLVVLAILLWCGYVVLFKVYQVPSRSMEPVLSVSDKVVVEKLSYNQYFGSFPKRGDVIVFNNNGQPFVKRIVGMPNDEIKYNAETMYINDIPIIIENKAAVVIPDISAKIELKNEVGETEAPVTDLNMSDSHTIAINDNSDDDAGIDFNKIDTQEYGVASDGQGVLRDINNKGIVIILQSNEYFVLGDNIQESQDSRVFGPINSSDIVGKVTYLYRAGKLDKL